MVDNTLFLTIMLQDFLNPVKCRLRILSFLKKKLKYNVLLNRYIFPNDKTASALVTVLFCDLVPNVKPAYPVTSKFQTRQTYSNNMIMVFERQNIVI